MPKFWNTKKNSSGTIGELILYGDIANESWWGDEVTPKQLSDDLKALGDVTEIHVRINSGGGDVFAGVAIHSIIKRQSAKIVVYIDGLAASIASIIAMAGEEIIMPKGSMMMIHNPWSFAWGESKDFRKMAETLDTIRASMLEIYRDKTGMSDEDLIVLLDAETWLTAADSVEKGFATKIEETPVAASLKGKTAIFNGVESDWSKFRNAPDLPEVTAAAPIGEEAAPFTPEEIEGLKALLVKPAPEQTPAPTAKSRDLSNEIRILELKNRTI